MRSFTMVLLSATAGAMSGCGAADPADLPSRLIGSGGQQFVVEDLTEISSDPDLTDEEKRDRFRELGIEDEKLIDALLDLDA